MGLPARSEERDKPSIFGFHHYRDFLKELLSYWKESHVRISLRALSKKAEMGSGYLPMVLSGKRRLTGKSLDKLLPHLGLNVSEESYFRWLVVLEETENEIERMKALKALQRFRTYQQLNNREMEAYQYLAHWYYVAIREMASSIGFQMDPKWIQARLGFSVPLPEVERALEFLKSNGFIELDSKGNPKPSQKTVDCENGVYRIAMGGFHREMFGLADRSIQEVPRDERSLTGHAVSIPQAKFEAVEKILEKARDEIQSLGQQTEGQGERVYYVGLMAFPLTKKGDDK